MRRALAAEPSVIALCAGLGALCAIGPFLAFSALARPAGFKARVEAISAQASRAEALAAALGDPAAYRRGALCGQPVEIAAPALRRRVETEAAAAGLSAPSIRAMPRRLDFEHGAPSVDLQIEAGGRYDVLVQLLGRLSQGDPQIFVDTLDLQSRVSAASLKLTGHVFCRTPARS